MFAKTLLQKDRLDLSQFDCNPISAFDCVGKLPPGKSYTLHPRCDADYLPHASLAPALQLPNGGGRLQHINNRSSQKLAECSLYPLNYGRPTIHDAHHRCR